LSGKCFLITGASKGIGSEIAKVFAQSGARVILTGRNIDELNIVLNQLDNPFLIHRALPMDLLDSASIKSAFNILCNEKIILDGVVNNAGIMIDSTLQMMRDDDVFKTFQTNVFGLFEVTRLASKSMLRRRSGSIINLTSIVALNGSAGQSIYSASKSAVIGFTKSLAKELAPLQIRANAIAPGFIETDMTSGRPEKFYTDNLLRIGFKRFGKPEDVAMVALFLASDMSKYMTGQVLSVDGGMVI
jgi:3-oxoacyl-[acyl-carrier protein] reductase